MSTDRYLANVAALGECVSQKLGETCVGIIGNNATAQATMYNLIGLGVGAIEHVTPDDKLSPGILAQLCSSMRPSCESLEDALFTIAPQTNYSHVTAVHSSQLLIDVSGSKELCTSSQQVPTIYCDAPTTTFDKYTCAAELLTGALLADEVRKHAGLVSSYEQRLSSGDAVSVAIASVLHKRARVLQQHPLKNVLVVGAGGLGTYCTYVLANRGVSQITVCDPDIIEETNLNRQLFYTGCVGKSKANVLAQRLSSSECTIIPRQEYFNQDFCADSKFDALFCCTDTLESRIAADVYACAHKIPLVEGACSSTMGSVTTYVPGKSAPISVQRNLPELLRLHNKSKEALVTTAQTSCAKVANPSIIGPNVIVGALQALALDEKFDAAGLLIDAYPQIFLNLLRNDKFSHGITDSERL